MKQDEFRRWAAIGAEKRLVELAAEAAAIYAHFPELRDQSRGSQRVVASASAVPPSPESHTANAPVRRRRRRRLSPEARKRIGDAQRARWAKYRKSSAAR